MINLAKYVLDRIFIVLGALIFLQIPLFMHQYQQQLIGRVAELQWMVDSMHDTAKQTGRTLTQYIQKFADHGDHDIVSQGTVMHNIHNRWQLLSHSLQQLEEASVVKRPFIFLMSMQTDIAYSTLNNFQQGLPLTVEGFVYCLLGMCFGFIFFRLIGLLFKPILKLKSVFLRA